MKFTKDEYIKLADRFNALPFPEQMKRVFDNPNVLSMSVTFKFKDVTHEMEQELINEGKSLKANY